MHEYDNKRLKLAPQLVLLVLFFAITSFDHDSPANRLLGVWESAEKNLHIEMFEEDGHYAGRMVWFLCTSKQSMMGSYCDTENPDPRLTGRPLIGLRVVEKISYYGNNTWGSGKIYDPNSAWCLIGCRFCLPQISRIKSYQARNRLPKMSHCISE